MNLSNKGIVRSFYQELIAKGNLALASELIAEDYIQHNPLLPTGRAGVLAAIQYLQQIPRETPTEPPIKRMIAEGNYVVVHLNVAMAGQHQVVMDVFRLANAQLVEHWDAIQSVSADKVPQLMAGPQEVEALSETQMNKDLIAAYCQKLVAAGQYEQTHLIIGEGNFVLAQSSGKHEAVPHVFYDLYCLEKGKIIKHWPVRQAIPEQMAHTNGMI